MSNWTHVAAVVRIDSLRLYDDEPNFADHFGHEVKWEDDMSVWDDAERNPEKYLPMGSEGSLQMSVWINPNRSHLDAYTVTIFGDLRDHDSPDSIIQWFRRKCENIMVRNATIEVANELNGVKTWNYCKYE